VAERESGSAGLAPAVRSFFECVSSIVTHYVVALFVPLVSMRIGGWSQAPFAM
jgi:hypothetical protein